MVCHFVFYIDLYSLSGRTSCHKMSYMVFPHSSYAHQRMQIKATQNNIRAGSRLLGQWEMALLCNEVSHWLGASLESALNICIYFNLLIWTMHTLKMMTLSRWCHDIKAITVLLALCKGPATDGVPMFSLILDCTNGWANSPFAGDLRRDGPHVTSLHFNIWSNNIS